MYIYIYIYTYTYVYTIHIYIYIYMYTYSILRYYAIILRGLPPVRRVVVAHQGAGHAVQVVVPREPEEERGHGTVWSVWYIA